MPGFTAEISGACCGNMPASPDAVGTVTESTSASRTSFSGVMISSFNIRSKVKSKKAKGKIRNFPLFVVFPFSSSYFLLLPFYFCLSLLRSGGHLLGFLAGLLHCAYHVESLLGHIVAVAL